MTGPDSALRRKALEIILGWQDAAAAAGVPGPDKDDPKAWEFALERANHELGRR